MFKHLTDFSYQRNWKEAIVFYLAYLILCFFLLVIAGVLVELSGLVIGFGQCLKFAIGIAITFCLIISVLLLKEKKLFKSFGYIFLVLLSGAIASFGGVLLGLTIPAFLTTVKSK